MSSESVKHTVASVVLNYNSDADVMVLVPQLLAQEGVDHSIIIVDNASRQECVQRLVGWLQRVYPQVVIGSSEEMVRQISIQGEAKIRGHKIYLILNYENRGYSAGNNIGIRLAERMAAKAVLIANPDMRIDDNRYIAGLATVLFSNAKNYVAASRVVGPGDKEQNPLRELDFWEELLWFRQYIWKKCKKPVSYIIQAKTDVPVPVPKVSGCCLMIKMAFLHVTDYLDENVFLYCEEPILSARVRRQGGNIIFVPYLSAVHEHDVITKGNSSMRMLLFIRSRKYFLRQYSGYGFLRLKALCSSYALLSFVHRAKNKLFAFNLSSIGW